MKFKVKRINIRKIVLIFDENDFNLVFADHLKNAAKHQKSRFTQNLTMTINFMLLIKNMYLTKIILVS